MPLETKQLRYAVLAAETRSFSRAAALLRIKQATLSRNVLLLEHRLGVKLFERRTRGAIVTPEGLPIIATARRILTDVECLQTRARAMRNGDAGELTIGFCSSLTAGDLRFAIVEFQRRFPDVRLNGVERDRGFLHHALHAGMIDLAVVTGDLGDPGVKRRPLWSERVLVALPDEHPLIDAERIYWHDLRRQTFVLGTQDPGPDLMRLLQARLAEPGYQPDVEIQDVSRENVLAMVSAGWFLTLVSESALGVNHPGIIFREVHEPTGQARIDYGCYWRTDDTSPALRRFLGLIRERYPDA
ncbi:LysR family transcriptional regulator [Sphingopyxis indica]|uniref:LysR family transcriptional regulator n=1 Tax=Sphingomonadales TaxID=204457 RepID=UPI002938F361|nr:MULTISPECIES: LysR family transcriptional regulator [Sphingomonadales]MEA3390394.1 LysR family transcriptional regulator [Pseudomonadota bacterium]WOF43313.1 LysR family transcriptional regulator [Sphingopyxis indica]WRO66105.1 LysR family transcriptional regulator [Tsuneonella sp. CC-YZS046]